jgi:hypothetical protein
MNADSMEVFAEARRADLIEAAETRTLLRPPDSELGAVRAMSLGARLRMAVARRLTRAATAS